MGCLALVAIIGCSSLTREEQAALAAEGFYRHLAQGEYEAFLDGRAGADSLPDDYREQLLVGLRQFVAQQELAHRGILDVQVSSAMTDSLTGYTNVLLILCFGDSIDEEVVVPMVEYNGSWRMK